MDGHEHILCQYLQVLHMLGGSSSPGRAFLFNSDQDAYTPAQGVHVPHLSPGALYALLQGFTHCATIAHRCCCARLAPGARTVWGVPICGPQPALGDR